MDIQGTLQEAMAHHQAGRHAEAEALYRQVLARVPKHPDALHLLGVLAHHSGNQEVAVQLIGEAIRAAPKHAPFHCNLGNALRAQGRLDEAIRSYRKALALKPAFAEAHLNLGNAWLEKGKLGEAAESYRRAAAIQPRYAEAHYNLGNVLRAQGSASEAAEHYRQAIAIRPDYVEAHNNLGIALQSLGSLPQAMDCYRQAIALRGDYAEAHNNLALALAASGDTEGAIVSLQRALAVRPDYAEAHSNLGAQFEAQGRLDEAIAQYRRALELRPGQAEALNNLGNALQVLGELDASVDSYRKALAARPDYADALTNLGNALQAQGRLAESIAAYDRVLALAPQRADVAWNKAFALLLAGDFPAGWALFESRWGLPGHGVDLQRFPAPPWLGQSPVGGRTILLHHEQGLGDTVQMLRYAPLLARQGARVIVEVPAALAALAATIDGVAQVIVQGSELPPFDLHCPFMSLPLAMGTTLQTVPADVPYLAVPEPVAARWRVRLGSGRRRRVGLVWSGSPAHRNDRHRSIALELLRPWLALDLEFISLQKEYRAGDAAQLDGVRDYAAQLTDLAETAGLIRQLDLVIAVDTAVAHLAGALASPAWLLLPFGPDYRWMLGREDSPWYPTLRLVRQPAPNDWPAVIDTVGRWLTDFAAGKPPLPEGSHVRR